MSVAAGDEMSEVHHKVELGDMIRGMVDEFSAMGAPEQDIADARQHAEGFIRACRRLNDWREVNGMPLLEVRGFSSSSE